jgi:hypothetical protein
MTKLDLRVDVITDTNIPCLRDEMTGASLPAYSRSGNMEELWIAFAEKAYAKAVGSYEAIPKVRCRYNLILTDDDHIGSTDLMRIIQVKIHESLLHLTGGSVQYVAIQDESNKELQYPGAIYRFFADHLKNDTMVLLLPAEVEEEKEIPAAKDEMDFDFKAVTTT